MYMWICNRNQNIVCGNKDMTNLQGIRMFYTETRKSTGSNVPDERISVTG